MLLGVSLFCSPGARPGQACCSGRLGLRVCARVRECARHLCRASWTCQAGACGQVCKAGPAGHGRTSPLHRPQDVSAAEGGPSAQLAPGASLTFRGCVRMALGPL